MTSLDRKLGWGIFGLLLVSYAYFYSGGGWNENSRLDLVRALVEDHTLAIDRFHRNTGDTAIHDGHFYSDKAPGLSFLAVPAYALLRAFAPLFGSEHDFVVFAAWLVTCLTVSLAGAVAGVVVYLAGRKLGASPPGALVAAVGYGLGTQAFPLSTMFFGHELAAAILVSAFYLSLLHEETDRRASASVLVLCASTALVEYPTLPAAVVIALYHLRSRLSGRTWVVALATLVPLAALGVYLASAFGSPVRVGYDTLSDPGSRMEMHSHGVFGVTYPKITVLLRLLASPAGGLFPYSPLLLLAIPGFLALARFGKARTAVEEGRAHGGYVAVAVVTYFLLFVSSYEWWQGGASFGSRHVVPMLPFLAVLVAVAASSRPRLALALLVPSVLAMTIVTAVHPKPGDWTTNPFWSTLLPSFFRGELSLTRSCPLYGGPTHPGHHPFAAGAPFDAFNVGMLLGGRGLKSLVPLAALWGTAAWAFVRVLEEEKAVAEAAADT